MRERESGGEINGEVGFEVADSDLPSVKDKLSLAEDPGSAGDVGGAEFHEDLENREQVDNDAEEDEGEAKRDVDVHTFVLADPREEEEEGVDEEADEGSDEEDVVPFEAEVAVGVENLLPPRLLAVVQERRLREAVEELGGFDVEVVHGAGGPFAGKLERN